MDVLNVHLTNKDGECDIINNLQNVKIPSSSSAYPEHLSAYKCGFDHFDDAGSWIIRG